MRPMNTISTRSIAPLGLVALALLFVSGSSAFAEKESPPKLGFWKSLPIVSSGKHLLVRCVDGRQRPDDGACLGKVSDILGWFNFPVYANYKVNPATGVVIRQFTTVSSEGNHTDEPAYLENCKVIDQANWRCNEISSWSIGTKFENGWHDGMKDGRPYRTASTNGVADYFGSSISGLALLAYQTGFVSLDTAANLGTLEALGYLAFWGPGLLALVCAFWFVAVPAFLSFSFVTVPAFFYRLRGDQATSDLPTRRERP